MKGRIARTRLEYARIDEEIAATYDDGPAGPTNVGLISVLSQQISVLKSHDLDVDKVAGAAGLATYRLGGPTLDEDALERDRPDLVPVLDGYRTGPPAPVLVDVLVEPGISLLEIYPPDSDPVAIEVAALQAENETLKRRIAELEAKPGRGPDPRPELAATPAPATATATAKASPVEPVVKQLRIDLDARHFEVDARGRANTDLTVQLDAAREREAQLAAKVADLSERAAALDSLLASEVALRGEATARVAGLELALQAEAFERSRAEAEVAALRAQLSETAPSTELATARRDLAAARSDLGVLRERIRELER